MYTSAVDIMYGLGGKRRLIFGPRTVHKATEKDRRYSSDLEVTQTDEHYITKERNVNGVK